MLKLGILISGSGTTAAAIIKAISRGDLKAQVNLVIASRADKEGVIKAKKLNIPVSFINPRQSSSAADFGNKLLLALTKANVNFVSQNGWIPLTPPVVVNHYQGKIVNQHPGPLDPGNCDDFGGKGMYGARVTFTRLSYLLITGEAPWTESTTHYVTTDYDQGDLLRVVKLKLNKFNFQPSLAQVLTKISLQKYLITETQDVQKKLLPIEHQNVINTLKLFTHREKVLGFRRKKKLIPENFQGILSQVKKLSIQLFPHG